MLDREVFYDETLNNQAKFKPNFSEWHDLALMHGMRLFGLMKCEVIKERFKMFEHVTVDAMLRRCLTLMNISSTQVFQYYRCDPFKIQGYFKLRL